MNNPDFLIDLLEFLYQEDLQDMVWWSVIDRKPRFMITCSDIFFWGSADGEDITEENFDILKQSIKEVKEIDEYEVYQGCYLFVARVRRERPQGAAYPDNKDLWKLFDTCGPEKPTGLGNPYKPGEYKKKYKTIEVKNE